MSLPAWELCVPRAGGVLVLIVLCILGACSDSKVIAHRSSGISELAHSSRDRFGTIEEQTNAPKPDIYIIREQAQLGRGEQGEIIASVAAIVAALPGVEDQTPWWATTIAWAMMAVSVVAVCIVLAQSGVMHVVGSWVRRLAASPPVKGRK